MTWVFGDPATGGQVSIRSHLALTCVMTCLWSDPTSPSANKHVHCRDKTKMVFFFAQGKKKKLVSHICWIYKKAQIIKHLSWTAFFFTPELTTFLYFRGESGRFLSLFITFLLFTVVVVVVVAVAASTYNTLVLALQFVHIVYIVHIFEKIYERDMR